MIEDVDVDSIARQVLYTDDFLPESYTSADDSFGELRPQPALDKDLSDDEIVHILRENPERLYRIGDVSEILDVKAHIVRYWETEFTAFVKPVKSNGGQRLYSVKDIESLLGIKKLLYNERFSIAGAKQRMREMRLNGETGDNVPKELLVIVKDELNGVLNQINELANKLT